MVLRCQPLAAVLGAFAIVTGSAGCTADDSHPGALAAADQAGVVHPAAWPQGHWPLVADARIEARVQELVGAMTLEQKVGQLVQGDLLSVTPDDVRKYHLGSVLAGGGSGPGGDDFAPASKWLALADAYYAASIDRSDGGAGIPVIFGVDAMHGHSNIIGATLFPHNIGLGAMRNPDLVRRIGEITALEVRVTGIDWTFAPTVTVPQDDRWGRTYEGYSEDPAVVASYAGAMVIGLQGTPDSAEFLDANHVIASAKHFLGDGGTREGHDQGNAEISEDTLIRIHAAGYAPAIAAGVQTIMASYSSWNGRKMHGNRDLLTDVLKRRMDFQGFVVGDWNGHGQVPGCSNESCAQAVNAGLDMYMAPDSWQALYRNLLVQARAGTITAARLDDAVGRILRVKLRAHLFEEGTPLKRPLAGHYELLGSPEHRAVAREAVRESLVLLKNNGGLLPLNPGGRVLVTGDGADNFPKQCGGWTVTWQGSGTSRANYAGATSIWGSIQAAVKAAGGQAELSADGRYRTRPDVAIVVFGEDPYAEFQGDRKVLLLPPNYTQHLDILRNLERAHIPAVAVFLSGRPLWVNRELNLSAAFVAAWLPGSEGAGVADLLFRRKDGSIAYDFRGKLGFSWPKNAAGAPLNVGQAGYDPLFPFGFGLGYAQASNLAALPEDSGVADALMTTGLFLEHGAAVQPWSLVITDGAKDITRVTAVPAAALDGRLSVTATEDSGAAARSFLWSGTGKAIVEISAIEPIDISRETNGDVLLLMRLRRDSDVPADLELGARCGESCSATIPLAKALADLPRAQWQILGVPLKCLQRGGADMSKIVAPMALRTSGKLQLGIARVLLGTVADKVVTCP